jgi:hypothetical protein
MTSSAAYWINLTNIALAIITGLCVLLVAGGLLHEAIWRRRRRASLSAEMDAELRRLLYRDR